MTYTVLCWVSAAKSVPVRPTEQGPQGHGDCSKVSPEPTKIPLTSGRRRLEVRVNLQPSDSMASRVAGSGLSTAETEGQKGRRPY